MTLVDAGPLIALVNAGDASHARCRRALEGLTTPLPTTWAVFAEAMHVAGAIGHRLGPGGKWRAQNAVWSLLDHGAIEVVEPTTQLLARMRVLMEKYRDTPMDLGDASLVALAEAREITRIFTLDDDFRVYRVGRKHFTVVPGSGSPA